MIIKIFVFLLILSILVVIKESYELTKAITQKTKFKISKTQLLFLALSIAYIFTIIFTGFAV
jgi:hypothetical protein